MKNLNIIRVLSVALQLSAVVAIFFGLWWLLWLGYEAGMVM